MSIYDEIRWRVEEGRLMAFKPFLSSARARQIYLSGDVQTLVDGPWINNAQEKRAGRVRAILEDFVTGSEIVGRMPPSKDVNTVIALLEPSVEEVWEFRIGNPKPGVRIFGRFADKDVLVGTCWAFREQFATERDWRDFGIERCKSDWRNLFPVYGPFVGAELHDYISNSRLPLR